MKFVDEKIPLSGHFLLKVYRRGLLVDEMDEPNLIVTSSKATLARLLGGDTTNRSVTKIGFGTSGTAPVVGNTGLTSPFVKAISSVTYPVAGDVQFNYALGSGEANGLAIMEFGLFTAGDVLIARKVRSSALNKDSDLSLTGSWTLSF